MPEMLRSSRRSTFGAKEQLGYRSNRLGPSEMLGLDLTETQEPRASMLCVTLAQEDVTSGLDQVPRLCLGGQSWIFCHSLLWLALPPSLLGARTLLVAPGITTRNKKLPWESFHL